MLPLRWIGLDLSVTINGNEKIDLTALYIFKSLETEARFRGFHALMTYLQFAAEKGDTAAEKVLKAINNGFNARLISGVLNLFRRASRVIDDRAKAYAKGGMMQGVDKKLREQIRQKKEGLGMRMG